MKNTRSNSHRDSSTAQQLTLLPELTSAPGVNARFLLSKDTRELGMRQVAEIRQALAERKAARDAANVMVMPARTDQAA